MKYVLADTSTYWWPVTVKRPDPECAGKLIEMTFEAEFEFRDQDQLMAEQEAMNAAQTLRKQVEIERENLAGRIVGWKGIDDGKGGEAVFSKAALMNELKNAWFRTGVYRAISESLSGEEARLGN
nr:hypothetical protein [uncultured Celeribacter sp.]